MELERKRADAAKLREAREARERQQREATAAKDAAKLGAEWNTRSTMLFVAIEDSINVYDDDGDDDETEHVSLLLYKRPDVNIISFGSAW